MQNPINTLYLVQTSYARLDKMLDEMRTMLQKGDQVVLLEDSLFVLHRPDANLFNQVAVLEDDRHFIQENALVNLPEISIITYAELADLMMNAKRVLSWK